MTSADQLLKQDWAGERERRCSLGKVPIPQYDIRRFIRLTAETIAAKDWDKFI